MNFDAQTSLPGRVPQNWRTDPDRYGSTRSGTTSARRHAPEAARKEDYGHPRPLDSEGSGRGPLGPLRFMGPRGSPRGDRGGPCHTGEPCMGSGRALLRRGSPHSAPRPLGMARELLQRAGPARLGPRACRGGVARRVRDAVPARASSSCPCILDRTQGLDRSARTSGIAAGALSLGTRKIATRGSGRSSDQPRASAIQRKVSAR